MKRQGLYSQHYASVKARGYDEKDSTYILTIHKRGVMRGGYELVENLPLLPSCSCDSGTDSAAEASASGEVCTDTFNEDFGRFECSISRTKSAIVQLVANNEWSYFVTWTLDAEKLLNNYNLTRYDLKGIRKVLCKFFDNYKQRSSKDFKYVLIPEFHKDGAVHFHGVFKGALESDLVTNEHGYLDFEPFCKRFGYCSLGKIRDLKRCAEYISKYISKDMFAGGKYEPGMPLYYASKGLNRDKVLAVGEPVYSICEFLEAGYEGFENEFCFKTELDDKEFALSLVVPFVKADENASREAKDSFYNIPAFLTKERREQLRKNKSRRIKADEGFGGMPEIKRLGFSDLWEFIRGAYCTNGEYDQYMHNEYAYRRYMLDKAKAEKNNPAKSKAAENKPAKNEFLHGLLHNAVPVSGAIPAEFTDIFADNVKYEQLGLGG